MSEVVKEAAAQEPTQPAATETKPVESKEAAAPAETPKAEAKADEAGAESKTADKPEGEKTPEKTDEVKLELTLPEGALLKPEHVETITSFAKEHGLSNAQAQKLLERDAALVEAAVKSQQEHHDQMVAEWKKAASEDKELGGQAFAENLETAHRALKAFASDELLEFLDATGLGNHPGMIRVFNRIGKAMAEDKFVHSKSTGSSARKDPAKVLYGNM
jgi:hypothetical protein